MSLPSVHWKWRMHGAAVTLAEQFLETSEAFDLVLAEDMMDVAVFAAIIRSRGSRIPIVTYFHENQISYPVSPRDTDRWADQDLRYGYINYTSALVSDRVFFNSNYHRQSFLDALPGFLEQYPDFNNTGTIDAISRKSHNLSLGLDLKGLETFKPHTESRIGDCPLLLWNHRREYDKNPKGFFDLVLALKDRGVSFEVAILGKQSAGTAALFEKEVKRLGNTVIHNGEVKDTKEYANWLWKADILPVTSIQDFFGGSVIEAVYCGCYPLLPDRLAYPEHFSGQDVYYQDSREALEKLEYLIVSGRWQEPSMLSERAGNYAWEALISLYDEQLQSASKRI